MIFRQKSNFFEKKKKGWSRIFPGSTGNFPVGSGWNARFFPAPVFRRTVCPSLMLKIIANNLKNIKIFLLKYDGNNRVFKSHQCNFLLDSLSWSYLRFSSNSVVNRKRLLGARFQLLVLLLTPPFSAEYWLDR